MRCFLASVFALALGLTQAFAGARPVYNIATQNAYVAPPKQCSLALAACQSLVSVTQPSASFYLNSSGVLTSAAANTPRFDYEWNGSAFAFKGLMTEEGATNLALNSTNLAAGNWSLGGATLTPNAPGPDGGSTSGYKIVQTATTGQHYIATTPTLNNGSAYICSWYVQLGTGVTGVTVGVGATDYGYSQFDLTTGTVTSNPAGGASGIQKLANGWFRVWAARVSGAGAFVCDIGSGQGAPPSVVGNTANYITVAYPQLEQTFYAIGSPMLGPTSPIISGASNTSKAADVATFSGSGPITADYVNPTGISYRKVVSPETRSVVARSYMSSLCLYGPQTKFSYVYAQLTANAPCAGAQQNPPTFAADAFAGSAGTDVMGRVTPVGGKTWQVTQPNEIKLDGAGNLYSFSLAGGPQAIFDSGVADFVLTANVKPYCAGTSPAALPSIIFRWRDPANYWALQFDCRSNTSAELVEWVNGSPVYSAGSTKAAIISGAFVAVAIQCYGPNITIFLNGVEAFTYVSTDYESATWVGVYFAAIGSPGSNYAYVNSFAINNTMGRLAFNWPIFTEVSLTTPQIATGPSYATSDVNNAEPYFDSFNGYWVLIYSCYATATGGNNQNYCYATSPSPDGPWTNFSGNPFALYSAGTGGPAGSGWNAGAAAFNGGLTRSSDGSLWSTAYGCVSGQAVCGATAPFNNASSIGGTWTLNGQLFTNPSWAVTRSQDAWIARNALGTYELWVAGVATNIGFGRFTSANGYSGFTADPNNPLLIGLEYSNDNGISFNALGEPSQISNADAKIMMLAYDSTPWLGNAYNPSAYARAENASISTDGGKTWHHRIKMLYPQGAGFMSQQVCDATLLWDGVNTLRAWHSSSNSLAGATLGINLQIGLAKASWNGVFYGLTNH